MAEAVALRGIKFRLAQFAEKHPTVARAAKYITPAATGGGTALAYHVLTMAPMLSDLAFFGIFGLAGGAVVSCGVSLIARNAGLRIEALRGEEALGTAREYIVDVEGQLGRANEELEGARYDLNKTVAELAAVKLRFPEVGSELEEARGRLRKLREDEASFRRQLEQARVQSSSGEKGAVGAARMVSAHSHQIDACIAEQAAVEAELIEKGVLVKVGFLGSGGMGDVYVFRSTGLDDEVVVKMLKPGVCSEQDIGRLKREAFTMAQVVHRNVARVYSLMDVEGRPSLVQEFIRGRSLAQIITETQSAGRKSLELKRMLNYALQMAEGIEAIHKKDIIHRDLKPENIMIADAGEVVKVLDFGLAKGKGIAFAGDTRLTVEGTTAGTPEFMAPEQFVELGQAGKPADVYSLGMIFYLMLTGELPFNIKDRGSFQNIVAALATIYRRKSEGTMAEIPGMKASDPMQILICNMLSVRPEERWEMGRVVLELKRIIAAGSSIIT